MYHCICIGLQVSALIKEKATCLGKHKKKKKKKKRKKERKKVIGQIVHVQVHMGIFVY